jgi:hypothetical protein
MLEMTLKTKEVAAVELKRTKQRDSGIYLCPEKCPTTARCCTCEFITPSGLNNHIFNGKHAFPKGITAKDKLALMASTPGGAMAVGSYPNRKTVSGKPVIECEEGVPCENAARCFGTFNRKDDTVSYRKPAKLVKVLLKLFKEL